MTPARLFLAPPSAVSDPVSPWHSNGGEGFCQAAESFESLTKAKIPPHEVTGSRECRHLAVRTLHRNQGRGKMTCSVI